VVDQQLVFHKLIEDVFDLFPICPIGLEIVQQVAKTRRPSRLSADVMKEVFCREILPETVFRSTHPSVVSHCPQLYNADGMILPTSAPNVPVLVKLLTQRDAEGLQQDLPPY
jgi:hypothetical protein